MISCSRCSNPIIGVHIPNDVYISYGIFILTSSMRILPLPLSLRAATTPANPTAVQDGADSSSSNKWLSPPQGPSIYMTLNTERAYEFTKLDLPTLPKPPTSVPHTSKEWMVTPDTLRYLAETVNHLNGQMKAAHVNMRKALAHCTLLDMENTRQAAKCKEMEGIVDKLKGPKRAETQSQISRIQQENKALLTRLDRLLQSFMERASPELSEHEAKWFEELKRIKQDVLGRARYDEDSLVSKTRLVRALPSSVWLVSLTILKLEKEYARILPPLQALAAKEAQLAKKHAETAQNLGFTQAFEYGERSSLE